MSYAHYINREDMVDAGCHYRLQDTCEMCEKQRAIWVKWTFPCDGAYVVQGLCEKCRATEDEG